MTPATLSQLWTLLLPLLVLIISYIIQQERWSATINGLIALIMVIIATIASLILQGGNLTDASVVAAFSAALQSEALAPLMPYLRSFPALPGSTSPSATSQATLPATDSQKPSA
jgi:hypothetical protein